MLKHYTLLCIAYSTCPTVYVNKHLLCLTHGRLIPTKGRNSVGTRKLRIQPCHIVKFRVFFSFVRINLILYDLLYKLAFIMSTEGVLMDWISYYLPKEKSKSILMSNFSTFLKTEQLNRKISLFPQLHVLKHSLFLM